MDIQATLRDFKTRLDPKIEAYFDDVLRHSRNDDALIGEALTHVKALTLSGGKRLRPAFMYYGYLAAGGRDRDRLLATSIAIELIHMFLLIHDDIIDRDSLRHGVPTLHRRYAEWGAQYLQLRHPEHFGDSIALIVGDMLFAFGNDVLFRSGFPTERVFAALSKMQSIVSHTAIGQARDIYLEYRKMGSEDEILSMYKNKTARYTVEGPLHLGVLLAADAPVLLETLSAYAIPIGIAFQIQDDILGIFGTPERTGKPVGSDIREGKVTLLVSRALHQGSQADQVELRRILDLGSVLEETDIERFRSIIERSGALASAKETTTRYIDEGRAALKTVASSMPAEAFDFLDSVAEYMQQRDI